MKYDWQIRAIEKLAEKNNLELDWNGKIEAGDRYIACRNIGPKLLTAKFIDERNWIVPTDHTEYSYDIWDCVKVLEKKNV